MTQSHPDLRGQTPLTIVTSGNLPFISLTQFEKVEGAEGEMRGSAMGREQEVNASEVLREENRILRSELEAYIRKTFKLQQLELQYQRIQRDYEDLARRQEKREQLEQQVRMRMEREFSRLRERNRELSEQLEVAQDISRREDSGIEEELKHELTRRNMIISEMVAQNKELQAYKERQDIELDALRVTLEEQRGHIQILDRALANQQERCLRLDEDLKKKSESEARCGQLERAYQALRDASEKREESHKKIRAQLEKQVAQLQLQKKDSTTNIKKSPNALGLEDNSSMVICRLQEELDRKEFALQTAQVEIMRWDHLHTPKEDRKSSDEERKSSSESDSRRQSGELASAHRKMVDLEHKIQSLEVRLAEKDAMIKVLRRHSTEHPLPASGDEFAVDSNSRLWLEQYPGSLDKTRWRLEAVKRRLVQPRSESTASGASSRLISLDSGLPSEDFIRGSPSRYGRGSSTGALSNIVLGHSRTQSSCDALLYSNKLPSTTVGTSTAGSASVYVKRREIYTLPTRRGRNKSKSELGFRNHRPKSADDHLLCGNVFGDPGVVGKVKMGQGGAEQDESDEYTGGSKTESSEQLWHV